MKYSENRKIISLTDFVDILNEVDIDLLMLNVKQEINVKLREINECHNIKEANEYFDILLKIQELLAKVLFKYHIKIPEALISFVKMFDRADTVEERNYIFFKIKSGKNDIDSLVE